MSHVFDFGISQEDAQTEYKALDINEGDRLLCISSAGEVALNIMAMSDVRIKSVDLSENQNYLCRYKLNTLRALDPQDAAIMIGFSDADPAYRENLYKKLSGFLSENEKLFWENNFRLIKKGVIHAGRFEKYIRKFNGIALRVIGKKNLYSLFELDTIDEQKEFFDRKIDSVLLKTIFNITFHPRIYKNRGIVSEGLMHNREKNISDFFYSKFRDFCCGTPARKNYFLQFTFFNKVLFPEALPEYLTDHGILKVRTNHENLSTATMSYEKALVESKGGEFNKFHLSNIGDWMDKSKYTKLLSLIVEKSANSGRISSRYIYYKHPVPDKLKNVLFPENQIGEELEKLDRYPFYGISPFVINKIPSISA